MVEKSALLDYIEKSRQYCLFSLYQMRQVKISFMFCGKLASSSYAYKDCTRPCSRCRHSVKCKAYAIFSFQVATRRRENEGCFPLLREVRENYAKRQGKSHVTNVGMPMAKNIERTSCLDYPQPGVSGSIAVLSFIGFKNN